MRASHTTEWLSAPTPIAGRTVGDVAEGDDSLSGMRIRDVAVSVDSPGACPSDVVASGDVATIGTIAGCVAIIGRDHVFDVTTGSDDGVLSTGQKAAEEARHERPSLCEVEASQL